jgi:hypothetical protein
MYKENINVSGCSAANAEDLICLSFLSIEDMLVSASHSLNTSKVPQYIAVPYESFACRQAQAQGFFGHDSIKEFFKSLKPSFISKFEKAADKISESTDYAKNLVADLAQKADGHLEKFIGFNHDLIMDMVPMLYMLLTSRDLMGVVFCMSPLVKHFNFTTTMCLAIAVSMGKFLMSREVKDDKPREAISQGFSNPLADLDLAEATIKIAEGVSGTVLKSKDKTTIFNDFSDRMMKYSRISSGLRGILYMLTLASTSVRSVFGYIIGKIPFVRGFYKQHKSKEEIVKWVDSVNRLNTQENIDKCAVDPDMFDQICSLRCFGDDIMKDMCKMDLPITISRIILPTYTICVKMHKNAYANMFKMVLKLIPFAFVSMGSPELANLGY